MKTRRWWVRVGPALAVAGLSAATLLSSTTAIADSGSASDAQQVDTTTTTASSTPPTDPPTTQPPPTQPPPTQPPTTQPLPAQPTPVQPAPATPPQLGSLKVTLSVSGTPDQSANEGYPFVVQVTCGGVVLPGDGVLTFDTPSSTPQTISDIPAGSSCTAKETVVGGAHDVSFDPPGGGATIAFGTSSQIKVINTFDSNPTAPTTAPTITSDKADYQPGATVLLNGGSWTPGETVHIVVNDDAGETWRHVADVSVDAAGTITDTFALPSWFVATYNVTATDSQGTQATATFTDSDPPSITVIKKTTSNPDPGIDFTFTLNGSSQSVNSGDADGFTWTNLTAGQSYALTEAAKAGWQIKQPGGSGINCNPSSHVTYDVANRKATIALAAGDHVTCTFTNEPVEQGSIKIKKVTDPGTSTDTFGFSGALSATLGNNQTASKAVAPGTYTVTEASKTGWDLTSLTCDDPDSTGNTSTRVATFKVAAGENVTCTFTNTQRGSITIVKDAVPDDPQHFGFTGGLGSFTLDDDGHAGTPRSLTFEKTPGTYPVTETAAAGWTLTGLSCTTVESTNLETRTATIALAAGENVTCTFTNSNQGSIKIKKVTDPGTSTDTFGFSGALSATLGNNQTASKAVAPGTYTVTEASKTGWDLTSLTCDDSDSTGIKSTGVVTFKVAAGENVTCTFTNTNQGSIKIKKLTDPATSTETFGFSGALSAALGNNQTASKAVAPGTYTVTEASKTGWALTSLTCDDSDSTGIKSTGVVTFKVAAGENVTCTFTNTNQQGSITIAKVTDPAGANQNFGFTATGTGVSDFTLNASGTTSTTFAGLGPGTFTFTEGTVANWKLTNLVCPGEESVSLTARKATVTLAAGQNVTCTFTNTLGTGSIKVVKRIDGKPADSPLFPFELSGSTVKPSLKDGGSYTWEGLPLGQTYTLQEDALPGWKVTHVSCTPGSDTSNSNPAVILLGDAPSEPGHDPEGEDPAHRNVTCTFTNEATATSSIAVKKVTDPAGSSQKFTFTPNYGDQFQLKDNETNTSEKLIAGTDYSVSESVPDGWHQTSASCNDGSSPTKIDLSVGENVVCTFHNTANRASISVVKLVDDKGASGWDVSATGPGAPVTVSPAGPVTTGVDGNGASPFTITQVSSAGSKVHLAETHQDGFTDGAVSCTNGASGSSGAADVTVKPGDNVVCTFHNTANRASISVVKLVDDKGASGWDVSATGPGAPVTVSPAGPVTTGVDGNGASPFTITQVSSAGSKVHLAETHQDGFTDGAVSCTNGASGSSGAADVTVKPGDNVVCTFHNTANRASISVVKLVDDKGASGWDVSATGPGAPVTVSPAGPVTTGVDGNGASPFTITQVSSAGSKVHLAETHQDGFTDGAVSCTNGASGSSGAADVTVKPGDNVVCTFHNTANRASISVVKLVDDKGASGWDVSATGPGAPVTVSPAGPVTTGVDGNGASPFTITQVSSAGSKVHLAETHQDGFTDGAVSCTNGASGSSGAADVTVKPGDNVVCTFHNTANRASISVVKLVDDKGASGWDVSATGPGAPVTVSPAGPVTTGVDGNGASPFTITQVSSAGSKVHLAETHQDGFTDGAVSCTNGASGSSGAADVTVKPGDNVVCTFHNTANRASISVVKLVDDKGASGWDVSATGPGAPVTVSPAGPVTTGVDGNGASPFTITQVSSAGSKVHLAETHQDGFTDGAVSCTNGASGSSGAADVTVKPGDNVVCTFHNSLNTAVFSVTKTYNDGTTTAVPVSVSCTPGTVVGGSTTAKPGSPAHVTVNGFTNEASTTCTATETTVPAGYTASGNPQGPTAGSCEDTLAAGGCTITNTLNTAAFTVSKVFSDGSTSAVTVSLSCPTATVVGGSKNVNGGGSVTFTVNGFATKGSTTCTATETAAPGGYTSLGPCSANLVSGQCTITNRLNPVPPPLAPPAPPAPPGPPPPGPPTVTPVVAPPPVVTVGGRVAVRGTASNRRRVLVAGEFVRLQGTAPPGCNPVLRVDGRLIGPVRVGRDGTFDFNVGTGDLDPGRHVAVVECTNPTAPLLTKVFWVAAPLSSSNILVVALSSMTMLMALGWVGLQTLAGVGSAGGAVGAPGKPT